MPRPNTPWFRKSKNTWYVTLNGRLVSLGVAGRGNRKQAMQVFARLLTKQTGPVVSADPRPTPTRTVGQVMDSFLAHTAARHKPHTVRTYRRFLEPFAAEFGTRDAAAVRPAEVEAFANVSTWGNTTRHGCLTAIATAFRHAGLALKLAVPPKASRGAETVITATDAGRVIGRATGDFHLLLQFLWLTGCRPSEAFALELNAVDWDNAVAILRDHKTAHATDRPRLLFLSAKAIAVLRGQAERYGYGPAFRMNNGQPWRLNAAVNRLWRINRSLGTTATLYGFRHTFATDALIRGLPDAQVAALLGHSGTAMLHRHYAHVNAQARAMREALDRVRG